MNALSGSFQSYPLAVNEKGPWSQYCSWLITVDQKYKIELNLTCKGTTSCNKKDSPFVLVRDGPDNDAPILRTFCGPYSENSVVQLLSSSNNLYIVSKSGSCGKNSECSLSFRAEYHVRNLTGQFKIVRL